jgi:hypothetical protein
MYRLLREGRFGNYPINWPSLAALQASGYQGKVGVRSLAVSNPIALYHVPVGELAQRIAELPDTIDRSGLVFTEALDESKNTLQGEYDGHRLTYTFDKNPMKAAFRNQCLHAAGLLARGLLNHYLEPVDVDVIDDLLHDFPGHIVEFSGFSIPVGQRRTKMVVWEVRAY